MSEQNEREAYNEAAREHHEGKEREEMDRPMFTQRDLDAAVQGEREAIKAHIDSSSFEPSERTHEQPFHGYSWSCGVFDVVSYIDSRGPAPAVDVISEDFAVTMKTIATVYEERDRVMAVVREYVEAYDDYQEAINFKKTCRNDESVTVAADRRIKAGLALRALVDGKGEAKP